jgi:hypothetical protein
MAKDISKLKRLDKLKQEKERIKNRDAVLAELRTHAIDLTMQGKLRSVVTSNKVAKKKKPSA